MRTTHNGLPFHILALATLGPLLMNEGGGDGDGGDGGGGGPAPVPYDRFKSLNDKHNTAKGRISELETQLQSFTEKAATVDTLAKTLATKEDEWGKERASYQERLGLSDIGLTSKEGQTVARSLYGALDEEARKVPFTDQVKAWKEKPEEAPAGLRPYLGGAGDGGTGGRRDPNKGTPNGNGDNNAGGGSPTVAALAAASAKAQRTGNWDEFNKLCEAAR
jgi:hypothetical protein